MLGGSIKKAPPERRITEKLILYWNRIRKNKPFPSFEDIDFEDPEIQDIWDDCFLVKLSGAGDRRNHNYTYIGRNIIGMFAQDYAASSAMSITDDLSARYDKVVETKEPLIKESQFTIQYMHVANTKMPMVDESRFVNLKNAEVKYRQILAPLGPDDGTVKHILGAMKYKIYQQEDV